MRNRVGQRNLKWAADCHKQQITQLNTIVLQIKSPIKLLIFTTSHVFSELLWEKYTIKCELNNTVHNTETWRGFYVVSISQVWTLFDYPNKKTEGSDSVVVLPQELRKNILLHFVTSKIYRTC